MIKLKTGKEIGYDKDFDVFFQNLLAAIVHESKRVAGASTEPAASNASNELLLKEIMDNSIYIAHQIMDIHKQNENLARFLVTGCLFNCAVLSLPHLDKDFLRDTKTDDLIH